MKCETGAARHEKGSQCRGGCFCVHAFCDRNVPSYTSVAKEFVLLLHADAGGCKLSAGGDDVPRLAGLILLISAAN